MGVKYLYQFIAGNMVYHWVLRLLVYPMISQSSSSISGMPSKKKISQSISSVSGMEIVDLLESLQLHNTTYAGLQQKPGPHSHHPAALFSGRHHFPPRCPRPWYPGIQDPGTLDPGTLDPGTLYPSTQVLRYWGSEAARYTAVPSSTLQCRCGEISVLQ